MTEGAAPEPDHALARLANGAPFDGLSFLCERCEATSRCWLNLKLHRAEDGGVSGDVRLLPEHQGSLGVTHGGFVTAVLDEAMGAVPLRNGRFAVTSNLEIAYRRPTPVEENLRIVAHPVDVTAGRWRIASALTLASSGELLASAVGTWVERDWDTHFSRFRTWAATRAVPGGDSPA